MIINKKDIGVSFSCFEDISLVNYYTNNAKKIINEFTNRGYIVYVHTNNPDEFSELDCYVVPSNLKVISVNEVAKMSKDQKDLINFDEYWTFYRKIEDIDYVLDRHDYCLYLDSDNLPVDDTFSKIEKYILNTEWEEGIYFNGVWGDLQSTKDSPKLNGYSYPTIGHLKQLEYFYFIDETEEINPSLNLKPFDESIMFIKKFDEWAPFRDLVLGKYQTIAIKNDKKDFSWIDSESYKLFGRAEGLGWTMAIEELGMFDKAKSDDRIYDIRKTFVVKIHPTTYDNTTV